MNKFDRHFWIPYIILLTLILIRLIPFFYPESRSWGFNHLIFLPDSYSFAFFSIAAVALFLPFLELSERWSLGFLEWFDYNFFENPKRIIYRLVFIFLMTLLFIIAASPTHFLGDGYDVIYNLASKTGIHIKWSEVGITKFMIMVRSFLGDNTEETARLAFQMISIISGSITIYFYFLISHIITDEKVKRYFIFIVSILSGSLLLFFGYAEYYPILWIFFVGTIYFSLKFLNNGCRLFVSWLFLACGLILHFQLVILIPAVIFATFAKGRGYKIFCKFKIFLISLGTLFTIALGVLSFLKYSGNLYFEDIFLPLFSGKPIEPGYAVFSLSHLIDIYSQITLLSPALFIFLLACGRNFRDIYKNNKLIFLGLTAPSAITFLFVIDPKLGMPRDWDLFSHSTFVITILAIILIADNSQQRLKKIIPTLTIYLLITTVPFFLVNLNTNNSEKYCEYIIVRDSNKSLSTIVVLQDYYKRQGQKVKVDSLKQVYDSKYSWVNQYNRAMTAMDNGNLDLTLTLLNGIKPDKFDGDYQRVWGRYYYMRGDLNKALKYLNKAIQLRKYNSMYFWQRAMIYINLEKADRALDDLQNAYDLDNSSLRVLDGLSYIYYSIKQYDSSIYYSKILVQIDSGQLGAYYMLANSYYKLNNYNAAHQSARIFIDKTESTNIYNRQREEMINIINLIGKDPKSP